MPTTRLAGRVAFVTGGSRGIGAAVAERLAAEGAYVVLTYAARRDAADLVVQRIRAAGGEAEALQGDLREERTCRSLVQHAARSLGRLDILVNNAGVAVLGSATQMTSASLDEAMSLAVHAPLWCAQEAVEPLAQHGCGRIINISSIGAMATAVPGLAPYAVAKSALNMLTKRLAFELGARRVTVNAICPGLIETGMGDQTSSIQEIDRMRRDAATATMLGRIGTPDDIAGVVAFVASDDGAFMTAQCLSVDGGKFDLLTRSG